MVNVIMLSVVMLTIVVPFYTLSLKMLFLFKQTSYYSDLLVFPVIFDQPFKGETIDNIEKIE
jgi:hypothetical protein